MHENTNLSRAITVTELKTTVDASVKELLADKQILAMIIKHTLDEFADMEVEEIIFCICDDIEVSRVAVDPGLSNMEKTSAHMESSNLGKAHVTGNEDKVPGEGFVTYDIRCTLIHKGRKLKLLLNVEGQKTSNPVRLGYHLDNRIVYYLARMISAQNQTEFFHGHYDDIKPVRSVWICMDSGEDEDSVKKISLEKKTTFGKAEDDGTLDLAKGIIVNIRLGENKRESKNKLIAMLEVLFSQTDAKQKKEKLARDYGMIMTQETERRLGDMCNISDLYWEMATEKGMREGMREGMKEGMKEGEAIGEARGREIGAVMGAIEMLRDIDTPEAEIAKRIKAKYKLSDEQVDEYMGVMA